MADVQPIPDDYPRVTAALTVDGAADAIDFYTDVLGATERMRMDGPGGTVMHAELAIGDGLIMVNDENPEMGARAPSTLGGSAVTLHVYVEDADDAFARALAAGATEIQPVADQFYGDRSGQFEDPFGHRWSVATHVEDVAPEEMQQRMSEWMQQQG